MAVVVPGAKCVVKDRCHGSQGIAKLDKPIWFGGVHILFDQAAGLTERTRRGVDGQGGLVSEQVPNHCGEDPGQPRVCLRYGDHFQSSRETILALGGHHNRRRVMGSEDGDFLGHVVCV